MGREPRFEVGGSGMLPCGKPPTPRVRKDGPASVGQELDAWLKALKIGARRDTDVEEERLSEGKRAEVKHLSPSKAAEEVKGKKHWVDWADEDLAEDGFSGSNQSDS